MAESWPRRTDAEEASIRLQTRTPMKRRRSAFLILTLGVTASLAATPAFAVSIPTVPVGAAWGANSNSTLGDGTATQRLTYTGIGSLQNVAQVSGGSDHSPALT